MVPGWAWLVVAVAVVPWVGMFGWVTFSYTRYRQYWAHKGTNETPMTFGEMVRYQVREVGAFLIIGFWALRAALNDGLRRPAEARGRPVLCVHGFGMNGTNFWGVRLALEAHGRPTRAVFMGFPLRKVRNYAPALVRVMRELVGDYPDGIDVIAHSMGGTVLRTVLADHPELAAHVRRIVTIGAPHHGTAVSRGVLKVTPGATDLARRSDYLTELPDFWESAPHALVTCVAARHDWIVYPRQTSLLEGTRHVVVDGVGHVGLLTWQPAIDSVVEALTAPDWIQERLSPANSAPAAGVSGAV